jgi:hypothetical protein
VAFFCSSACELAQKLTDSMASGGALSSLGSESPSSAALWSEWLQQRAERPRSGPVTPVTG